MIMMIIGKILLRKVIL